MDYNISPPPHFSMRGHKNNVHMGKCYTNVQPDIAMRSQLFCHKYLSRMLHPMPFNPFFKQAFVFICLQYKSVYKTLKEKEKLLLTSNFSFSPQCFLPFWRSFLHQLQNCRLTLFQFRNSKICC